MVRSLLPHATKALETPAPAPGWAEKAFEGKLAFLKCTKDAALPPSVQDMFVQRSRLKWIVEEVKASHTAYVSQPEKVVGMLVQWADVFEKMHH